MRVLRVLFFVTVLAAAPLLASEPGQPPAAGVCDRTDHVDSDLKTLCEKLEEWATARQVDCSLLSGLGVYYLAIDCFTGKEWMMVALARAMQSSAEKDESLLGHGSPFDIQVSMRDESLLSADSVRTEAERIVRRYGIPLPDVKGLLADELSISLVTRSLDNSPQVVYRLDVVFSVRGYDSMFRRTGKLIVWEGDSLVGIVPEKQFEKQVLRSLEGQLETFCREYVKGETLDE